ncbi:hypothetical protein DUNSADRAFT_17421 [Dunaliella salina]|uniref:Encoded protein n=1 Tax=Dunaliella salina TaxID=3046 RepID=A0ABQ7H019_DUNSA|nr:hypothetical protein DUNSADRAFT_17421 [Dunaliella salina]|eukprot:KAF5840204.1 hypothetical protein DUNSADRAFT_17421 [Dunaliella salina]
MPFCSSVVFAPPFSPTIRSARHSDQLLPVGGGSILGYLMKQANLGKGNIPKHCGFYMKDIDLLAELQWLPHVRCFI